MAREKDTSSAGGCRGKHTLAEDRDCPGREWSCQDECSGNMKIPQILRTGWGAPGSEAFPTSPPAWASLFCEFACPVAPVRGKMFPLTSGRWTTVCTIPRCMSWRNS